MGVLYGFSSFPHFHPAECPPDSNVGVRCKPVCVQVCCMKGCGWKVEKTNGDLKAFLQGFVSISMLFSLCNTQNGVGMDELRRKSYQVLVTHLEVMQDFYFMIF